MSIVNGMTHGLKQSIHRSKWKGKNITFEGKAELDSTDQFEGYNRFDRFRTPPPIFECRQCSLRISLVRQKPLVRLPKRQPQQHTAVLSATYSYASPR